MYWSRIVWFVIFVGVLCAFALLYGGWRSLSM
jgi:hypothetical protein